MKLRLRFHKLGPIKFISHLDTLRLFQRALSRSRVPMAYSQGFNPHPKISIAIPLSLGVESQAEFMDIEVEEGYDPKDLKEALNRALPRGLQVEEVRTHFNKTPLFSRLGSALYRLTFPGEFLGEETDIVGALSTLLDQEDVLVPRRRKKGKKKIVLEENIRPLIKDVSPSWEGEDLILEGHFLAGEGDNLRPDRFLEALKEVGGLDFDMDQVQVRRQKIFDREGEEIHG